MAGGDPAEQKFVEEWTPFVRSIVHKIVASLALDTDVEELIAFGFKGLLEARARFDPSRGVQLNTFAYYRVRGAVLDGVRDMAYLPRRVHGLQKAAMAADSLLEATGAANAAAPPGTRLGKETAAGQIDDLLGKLAASFVLASLGQDASARPPSPEQELVRAGEAEQLRRAIAALDDRERALVEGFYFEERRFDEVAAELGISKSWASRIHAKALEKLKGTLGRER